MGISLGNGSNKAEIESLEAFERKKATIETIFTLAILYSGTVQIIVVSGIDPNLWLALSPVVILLVFALLLGWENLVDQVGKAISL
ncbi:hypothetical protein ACFOZ7_11685 [Natribaculum luteum]|uniref:Uncharacterized protein n=1 Tax=Natribaculum luteum TaxID=1586232 RepID=A0ABD5P019_9EURY|nr:hypothetical protein [Natribaculum luteum]